MNATSSLASGGSVLTPQGASTVTVWMMGSGTQVRSRLPFSASDRYHLFMVCNTTAYISINLLLYLKNFNFKVFEVIILE